jgi:hypothetical protein
MTKIHQACAAPAAPAPLPVNVLEQLRQWRLRAQLRFVGKSLSSQSSQHRKAAK